MEFLENLEEVTRKSVEEYRQEHGELPLEKDPVDDLLEQGEPATGEEVQGFLQDHVEFYDELLELDSSEMVEVFEDNMRYDPDGWQTAKDMANPMNAVLTGVGGPATLGVTSAFGPLGLAAAGTAVSVGVANYKLSEMMNDGVYMPGRIGVSSGQEARPMANKYLASELFHAYQHRHGSDTNQHSFLREGLERAASIRALEQEFPEHAEAYRTHVLLNGYAQAMDIAGEELDIGLDEDEREILEDNQGSQGHLEYNLPAAMIYATEEQEDEVYSGLFHGDYQMMDEELDFMEGNDSVGQKLKNGMWKAAGKLGGN